MNRLFSILLFLSISYLYFNRHGEISSRIMEIQQDYHSLQQFFDLPAKIHLPL